MSVSVRSAAVGWRRSPPCASGGCANVIDLGVHAGVCKVHSSGRQRSVHGLPPTSIGHAAASGKPLGLGGAGASGTACGAWRTLSTAWCTSGFRLLASTASPVAARLSSMAWRTNATSTHIST